MMSTTKRSSDVLISPEIQPKEMKKSKINLNSPMGLQTLAMATKLPVELDMDTIMTELKAEYGKDLPKNSDRIVEFIVKKVNKQISGCTNTLEYLCGAINTLETQQEALQALVEGMSKQLNTSNTKNHNLKRMIVEQENYSRRENLILKGIPENRWQNLDSLVRDLLADRFGMHDVKLERLHRLGTFKNIRYSRPVIVRFAYFPDREFVWQNRKRLAGTRIYLDEDFSPETQAVRRKLRPVMEECRRQNYLCEIEKDKLRVNGKLYDVDALKNLPKEIRDGSRWIRNEVFFFGELCPASNFHPAEFNHEGRNYENSEKALFFKKAMLFEDEETAKKILNESDPRVIKRLSKEIKNVDEAKWTKSIKELVTPILIDKFSQNDHLSEWLQSTEDRKLVEAAGPHDPVWGNGLKLSDANVFVRSRWTGENMQGEMLMAVREHLRRLQSQPAVSQMEVSFPSSQGFDPANKSF